MSRLQELTFRGMCCFYMFGRVIFHISKICTHFRYMLVSLLFRDPASYLNSWQLFE